jgi:hypothetical protein
VVTILLRTTLVEASATIVVVDRTSVGSVVVVVVTTPVEAVTVVVANADAVDVVGMDIIFVWVVIPSHDVQN